jgi:hypothetical protein
LKASMGYRAWVIELESASWKTKEKKRKKKKKPSHIPQSPL